ncbi:UNVERIFIED_ORG: TonB-linked SusC/RagA family outer membrane protein [Chitinophaga ginsengisegetis]
MKFSAQPAEGGKVCPDLSTFNNSRYIIRQIMRLSLITAIITFATVQLISATPGNGQGTSRVEVMVELHNESVFSAIKKIEQQTDFRFVYRDKDLAGLKDFNLPLGKRSVRELLDLLFDAKDFRITELNNKILISPAEKNPAGTAQDIRVMGIVMDESGDPIPGVTVRVKNNNSLSTATDQNGHFNITIPETGSRSLLFSYIGYKTQEIDLGNQTSVRVVLSPLAGSLNEVVVIGYGTSTRKDLTGSIARVNSKTIQDQPVGNVINALQGRMAGVEVSQSNGLPGSGTSIKIRGQYSINSGVEPLYVIDGVPFNFSLSVYQTGSNGTVNPLNSLNPGDIESIDVLKDGDATAIYGARGGNGVILITTKKGKAGKTKLDLNLSSGIGKVGNKIDMLNGEQYLALRKEAFANDKVTPTTANAPDLTTWSQTKFRNWQDDLLGGTARYTDAQGTLSGGNEDTHFAFSSGYHHEGTVFPGSFAEDRISARLNIDHTSKDRRFYALISAAYSYDKNNLPTRDLSSYYNLPPNYDPYTSTGAFNFSPLIQYNPYALLAQKYKAATANLIGNMSLRYRILPGLSLKANLGYTSLNFDQNAQFPSSTLNPSYFAAVSNAVFGATSARSYIAEPQLEYIKDLGKGKLTALLGSTFQSNTSITNTTTGNNYSNDALLGSMAAAGTLSARTAYDNYNFSSVFGRITYNWQGKYILNATMRRDGSSRFGLNNEFGNFGAIGAAWVFSEEPFVKDQFSFLSFGKLRGSYGVTGNDQIPNYQNLSTYTASGSTSGYQGITVQNPSRLANPDIKWESNKKAELALELGFLKDRIQFTAAAYRNTVGNQLLYISTPGQVGFTSYLGNFPATIQAQGLEFDLNTKNIERNDFRWSTSFNFTINKSKISKFDNLASLSFYANQFMVGYPVPFSRQYIFNGIDPNTGIVTYQTANPNGIPSYLVDQQPTPIGNPYYGGLSNNFTYKRFELGFFFQFKHQNGYINGVTGSLGSMNNQNTTTLDHWKQPKDNTQFGAPTANSSNPAYNAYSFYYNSSTAFYGDASWLKLKNVNLAYNFPKRWITAAKLANLRVYAQAQNVFTISKYKNAFDPEMGAGQGGPGMPALRTIVFGLNASF